LRGSFYIGLFFKDNAHLYTATQCVGSTDGCLPQAKSKTNVNPEVFLT
ncbi:TPA_asm: hypothetical protein G4X86_004618, partial [Salmonella enterica]|nr:hypothetical protein [Salmonella enterica]HAE6576505.1 hypothetical protein [Salmonella enterica]HAE9488743.1 hypothetical protein [Salmonella enterica]